MLAHESCPGLEVPPALHIRYSFQLWQPPRDWDSGGLLAGPAVLIRRSVHSSEERRSPITATARTGPSILTAAMSTPVVCVPMKLDAFVLNPALWYGHTIATRSLELLS